MISNSWLKVPKIDKKLGQSVSMAGALGYNIGIGWNGDIPINADLFACVYDKLGNLISIISGYDGSTEFQNSSIVHSGDCRKGGKESRDEWVYNLLFKIVLNFWRHEANESLTFNFGNLPEEADSIVIGIVCDREKDKYLGDVLSNCYINGFPIFKFISQEDYSNNEEVVKYKINLEKKKLEEIESDILEESKLVNEIHYEDELPNGVFTYNIKALGNRNGYIPGKWVLTFQVNFYYFLTRIQQDSPKLMVYGLTLQSKLLLKQKVLKIYLNSCKNILKNFYPSKLSPIITLTQMIFKVKIM